MPLAPSVSMVPAAPDTVSPSAPSLPSAPASPSAPAQVPAPTPDPTPAGIHPKAGSEAFASLEAIGIDDSPQQPAPPPDPDQETPEPAKPKAPEPKPAAPPAEDKVPTKAAELRKAYDEQKKLNADLKSNYAKLEQEYKQFKETPRDDPEKKQMAENLAAREKRLAEMEARSQELETELKFSAYHKSAEYKERYEKPYVDAWRAGASNTASLEVVEKQDENGTVTRQGRDATAKDFEALMEIQSNREAAKWAADMFGPQAPTALYWRSEVNKLAMAGKTALEEYSKQGAERESRMAAEFEKTNKEIANHWQATRDAAVEKFPQYFKDDPDDPKGNELLAKGRRFADRAWGSPPVNGEAPLSPKQRAEYEAVVYNKAVGFDRLAHRLFAKDKTIADLQAKLAKYEASKPGPGDANGRGAAIQEISTPEAAFNKKFGG